MSSANTFGRPAGFISIPVEIVSVPNTTNSSSHYPQLRTVHHDNPYSDFSNSPPWKKPSINTYSKGRFQPRQNLTTAYDRLLNDSQFNQPYNDRFFHQTHQEPQYRHFQQRTYEPNSLHISRSSEDLLSTPSDFIHSDTQSHNTSHYPSAYNNGFRSDSDFVKPNKYTSHLRRSYDILNDYPDANKKFSIHQQYPSEQQTYYRPTYVTQTTINPNVVYSTEYHTPINNHRSNTCQGTVNSFLSQQTTSVQPWSSKISVENLDKHYPYYTSQRQSSRSAHDRSRSPASQRDESPTRPSPPSATSQQPQESDFKVTKDATSQMAGQTNTTTSSSSPSNDQQVPSNDTPVSINISSTPLRDSNTIALEKLEQIKQNLADLNQQVDAFTGLTRDDRIYKELDEQALKMMIRCDELIDVSVDIKEKRKEMVRNVQTVLAKLESKVPMNSTIENNSNQMETTLIIHDPSTNHTEQQQSSETQKEETSVERST
ncbi:unnamed protein product [Rotaria sp. Silwood2]|nr:unnamed protein product [Rotaria sp. Silwood2]CAF4035017.1 unnamed protein product [Rotaria sp. Silwood2]